MSSIISTYVVDSIGTYIPIIVVIITAITSIIVAKIANDKKLEREMVILEKISILLEKDNTYSKLEVSKLFEKLTGLQYKYSEIKEILKNDEAIWIIYALQKSRFCVAYENGQFVYTKNKFLRTIFNVIDYMSLFILLILSIFSILTFVAINDLDIKVGSIIMFLMSISLLNSGYIGLKIKIRINERIKSV